MGLADLHIHIIYSYDGTACVPVVPNRAKQIGLDVCAITDHDNIAGSLKAPELAPRYGIEVIPGIEHKKKEWTSVRILSSWAANYVGSALRRFATAT